VVGSRRTIRTFRIKINSLASPPRTVDGNILLFSSVVDMNDEYSKLTFNHLTPLDHFTGMGIEPTRIIVFTVKLRSLVVLAFDYQPLTKRVECEAVLSHRLSLDISLLSALTFNDSKKRIGT
jgi:hypothetical protein